MRGEIVGSPSAARPPGLWLQVGSIVLPIVKCAFCPVCLGFLGSALAGGRLAFGADERLHGLLVTVAVLIDGAILSVARRHHRRPGPLALCAISALVAFAGHFSELPALETAGFAGLMIAAFWNVLLLRRHRHAGACCTPKAHAAREGAPT